ncbi:MAG: DUF11 domain-containing protein [Nitrospirae bacterium]|nr:DUF11 domain-containing protein [Nitrospirota bacterium]
MFTVNAGPKVTSTSPNTRGRNSAQTTVTITGTGFAGGATVNFNDAGITQGAVTVVNATTITLPVTVTVTATPGAHNVSVTNTDGGAGTGSQVFTVTAAPSVASASPNQRPRGSAQTTVTITGTGFASGAAVSFNDANITLGAVTVVNSSTITLPVTVTGTATVGSHNVTVTNADGGTATGTGVFTVTNAPTVTYTSPNALAQGSAPTTVTITGTGFAAGSTVSFNDAGITLGAVTVVNATTITLPVTVTATAAAGSHNVTVTNADGGSGTGTAVFTVGTSTYGSVPYWDNGAGAVFAPQQWPTEAQWVPYTWGSAFIKDPRVLDPSNGGTRPQNYVNVSSGCPDQSLPSMYVYYANNTLYFRWRVEQIPNTYATGPGPGAFSDVDPWKAAQWTVFLDTDGDGFREFGMQLDGSTGMPAWPVDILRTVYSNTLDHNMSPHDRDIFELWHNPTAFVDGTSGSTTDTILNFHGTNAPDTSWPNGPAEVVWDYGTTRAINITDYDPRLSIDKGISGAQQCGLTQENEYFVDYQIPVGMLSNGSYNFDCQNPTGLFFATANSLTNPFQKDVVANTGYTGASENCAPYGDQVVLCGPTGPTMVPQPVVDWVTTSTSGCNQTLTAKVRGSVVQSSCSPDITGADFYYYYDANANGLADDGGAWHLLGAGSKSSTDQTNWTYLWNTTGSGLPAGNYLVGVDTVNSIGYHTWSYSSTPIGVSPPNFANPSPKPGLVYGSTLLTGACGETAIVDKTVTPGKTIINSTVQFTITVHNNTSGDMQVNSVTDYLPQGVDGYSFAYISSPAPTGTGALSAPGAPTVSGTTVTWNFSPARTISAGQNATITFTSQAPSVEGTYQNTCGANAYVTSWGMTKNINCNYVTIEVGAPRLTIAKTADVTSRAVGETINYTVTYSNDSPFTATGAYITDVLPAGLTFVSAANDGTYNSSNRTITWYIGTIYGGTGPFTVSFVATVTNPYPATEPIKLKNVATIYSNETTPKQADVTVIITGLSRPILTIQKIGNKVFVDPTQASPADRVTYTISYSNVGNATATNSIISDTVPPGWTYVSSAAGTNCPAGTTTGNPVTLINWNLGSVAVGVTGTCNLILRAADSQSSPYTGDNPSTNTASIRADGFPPVSSSFTVALTGAMQCTGTKYFFHEETTNVGYDGVKEIATVSYPSSGAAAYKHVNWMSQGCDIGSYSPIVDFYMDPVLVNTGTASSVTSSWYLTKTNGNPSNVKVSVYDYNPTDGNKTLLASVVHSIKGASQTPSLDSDTFILNQAPLAGHRLYWLYEGCTTAQNQILDVYYYYDGIYTDSNSTVPTPSHFCYQGTSALMNKTVDKMTAIPGDTLTYTMTFGNNGATNLTGAQITDTLPTGTTYVSATLNGAATTCSQAGQIITCGVRSNETPAPAVGTITVGQQGTLVIIATVNNPFPAGQYELINSATLTTSQAAPITATARTVVTTDISISKSVDKTLLYPGDMATFTLSVKNSSGANITVNIGDVLPTDTYFYYVGCSDACGWDSVSHTVTWTNITVNANSSRSVTFQMRVDTVGVPIGTTYKDNTGVVTYGSQQYSNTVTVAILNNPNINITKSVSPAGPVKAGDTITWNMTVTNNGPQSAFGVLVTDPIIPYTTYKTGSLTYELTAQTDANDSPTDTSYYDAVNDRVVYEVGTLAGGASRTMSFSAIVDRPMPSGTTVLTNTATVSSSNTGTKQATATINVTDAPSFVLNKYAASLVASGQNVTFTVYYKNTGGATATSAVVTDTLAANLTFVSADEGGTYDSGTRTVTWNLGTLPPDAEGSLHLTVTPAVCGTYSNTATISSAQTAPLNSNITSTDVCWLEPTKKTTTDPTLMTVTNTSTGTLATYILTVSNPTGTTATGVQVTDNFPSGFSYDSSVTPVFGGTGTNRTALVNPSNGATHPTWGTWDINAGGSLTIAFTAKVASTVPEGIYDNGVAATSTNNSVMLFDELATAADDVKVVVPVDLSVTKTVNIAEPQGTGPGAEFVYTITLTNVGVNHAFKVNLSDLLPSDITYVSNTASQGSYSNATGIWDVGRVDRYAGATLTITAFPNDGTAGMTIDNCAYLTSSVPREPSYSDPDDWSCASIKPTHVTLSGFRAFVEGGSVVVEWETAAERNTVGFYVERYHEKTGEYVRVNKKLLPGLITSRAGGTYRLIDEAAPASGRLLYRLLEVESKGNKVTYGPFHVDLGGSALKIEKKFVSDGAIEVTIRRKVVSSTRPADLSRQGFEQVTGVYSRKAHRPSPQTAGRFAAAKAGASAVQPAAVQAGTAIKMAVSETGLYYIDASDISALLNITQSSVRARIGAGDFALTTGGRQVAYTGAEGNAGIFFYGKALESVYTGANIYWIKEGRGLLMQTVGGDKETLEGVAADAFADTIHAEQDVWSDTSLAKDPNSDYWYWDYVMADYPGFDYKEFSFRADSVSAATGTATIGARLQSIVPFRSRAVITLNGSTTIFDGIWDGLDPKTVVANIDQGLLREGDNIIGVRAMLESGVDFSAFYIDSFDVTYARRFEAVNDSLSFRSEGSPVITVDGFTTPDISVFEITNSQRPRLVTAAEVLDQGGASYSVRFYPVRTAASYIAVTTGSIKRADAAADRPSDLRKNDNAAEYVVIAPAELKDAVAGLAEYRRGQGMTVKVAMLEDIMDEFNFGVSDPNAIRTFLEYAYKNWKKKPRYAALAGSGTFDYKNYGGYGGNLIPALMVGSPWGLSPSDNVLGDFNNDDVPEIIVGRLPVLSSAELQVLINKIMTFEASHSEGTILIADKADGGGDFPKDSNEIAGLFTAGYPLQRIYLQENQLAQARKSLFDGMKAGTKFINYLGHGTVERLSEGGLLTKDDAAGLINSAYPVMTALTCSSGHYALPGFDALMEALIIRNGGGIVSSWAPTDWSYNADAKILGEGFYKAVFRPVVTTMGDAVTRAMTAYKASGRASYELNIFNIIGDPALRLK